MLPKLRPLPIKDRVSVVWVEKGRLDMLDGAVSHRAVKLAARVGCLLLWVGEGGVRLYAAGQRGGARSDRLLPALHSGFSSHPPMERGGAAARRGGAPGG